MSKNYSGLKNQHQNTSRGGCRDTCTLWYHRQTGEIIKVSDTNPDPNQPFESVRLYSDEKGALPEVVEKNRKNDHLDKILKAINEFRQK